MKGTTTKLILGILGVSVLVLGLVGPASAKLVKLGSGDVLDTTTGLRWQGTPGTPGNTLSVCDTPPKNTFCTLQEAIDYCAALKGGYRLPEVKELISLVDYSVASPGPVLPPGHPFTEVDSGSYWSVELDASNSLLAWLVNFFQGDTGVNTKANASGRAWCVR